MAAAQHVFEKLLLPVLLPSEKNKEFDGQRNRALSEDEEEAEWGGLGVGAGKASNESNQINFGTSNQE